MKSCRTLVVKLSISLKIITTGGDSQCLDENVLFLHGDSVSVFCNHIAYIETMNWGGEYILDHDLNCGIKTATIAFSNIKQKKGGDINI